MSNSIKEIPAGFVPLRFRSAYLGFLGPFYEAKRDGQAIVGLPLEDKHMNLRSMAHGESSSESTAIRTTMGHAKASTGLIHAVSGSPEENQITISESR